MIDMTSPIEHYYRRDIRLLFLVGLWPYQNLSERIFRSFIVNVALIIGLFYFIIQLYTSHFDIKSNIKELQLFMLFLCCSISYYNIILKFQNAKKIRDHIVLDWEKFSNEEELFILRKYADQSENFTIAISVIFYAFAIFLVCPSLFHFLLYAVRPTNDTQLIFPVQIQFFFYSDKQFYLLLTAQYTVIWIVCTLAIAMYSSFILFIIHGCALLSLVTFKIDQPFKKVSSKVPYDWSSSVKQNTYEWVKEIVRRYGNATEFIDMVNDTTDKLYIIQVGLGIILIIAEFFHFLHSFEMTHSSSFTQYMYDLLVCSVYISGSTFTVYLNCYIGQKLMDHGTEVLESFNRISLYELPPSCQKVLPLLIMRSAKPCVVTIGGMFAASNDFFARFMNTSLSYAMVCYNMR